MSNLLLRSGIRPEPPGELPRSIAGGGGREKGKGQGKGQGKGKNVKEGKGRDCPRK